MNALPRNALFDSGIPQPRIYHLDYFNHICLRGSVYFPCCFPTLPALSAASKSREMSSAFLPTRPQPRMKKQQVTARNMNVHISPEKQSGRRPKGKHRSQQPHLLLGDQTEGCLSPPAVGIGCLLRGNVYLLLDLWTAYSQCDVV